MYLKAMAPGSAGIIASTVGIEQVLGETLSVHTQEITPQPEPEFVPVVYNFESFDSTGETKYGEGTVETTGNEENGKTEVEVLTNNSTDENAANFVGLKFWVNSNALTNGTQLYVLYDADGNNTGIKVKITE